MWEDLVAALAVMAIISVVGIPTGLALGYFVNPWWYLLAGICSIPVIMPILTKLGIIGKKAEPPPPPPDPKH